MRKRQKRHKSEEFWSFSQKSKDKSINFTECLHGLHSHNYKTIKLKSLIAEWAFKLTQKIFCVHVVTKTVTCVECVSVFFSLSHIQGFPAGFLGKRWTVSKCNMTCLTAEVKAKENKGSKWMHGGGSALNCWSPTWVNRRLAWNRG